MYNVLCASLTLTVLLLYGCVTIYRQPEIRPTEEQLSLLDPRGVVETYWSAALAGDKDTVAALAAPPNDSLLWDCPPPKMDTKDYAVVKTEKVDVPRDPYAKNFNYLEMIQLHAEVIRIARKKLNDELVIAESKDNGSEARLIYRPRSSRNTTRALVFFMRKDERWKLIDVRDEFILGSIGNKKFGEERHCATTKELE